MSVKRYTPDFTYSGTSFNPCCRECDNGKYVLHSDYAALLAATQWRPIETAPKDGTEILLACVGHDDLKIGVKMHKEDTGSDLLNSCYVIVSSGAACQPTHWMPLPKPPTA